LLREYYILSFFCLLLCVELFFKCMTLKTGIDSPTPGYGSKLPLKESQRRWRPVASRPPRQMGAVAETLGLSSWDHLSQSRQRSYPYVGMI
jgi:hypothetical protein